MAEFRYQLPDKLKNLVPYAPMTGNYRIRLDANESFIQLPDTLRQEIAQAVSKIDFNRYPDPYCTKLCEKFAGYFGLTASNIVAGNGSDELIGLIVSWFTNPGDTMVVVKPDFSMYGFYAQPCGVRLVTLEKDENSLALDAEALIDCAKREKARLVIFSNPCNPTSLVASEHDILKIVEGLPDCLVVVDEAYMDFSDEGSILRLAAEYDNLMVLKTFSKAFGMAAIRLGFAVAHPKLITALKAAKSPYNINTMTQEVGSLLLGHSEYLQECIHTIKHSRDMLYNRLCELSEKKPELLAVQNTCANFVFLLLKDSSRVFLGLEQQGIAIRNMKPFLRISAGSPEENEILLAALEKLL